MGSVEVGVWGGDSGGRLDREDKEDKEDTGEGGTDGIRVPVGVDEGKGVGAGTTSG